MKNIKKIILMTILFSFNSFLSFSDNFINNAINNSITEEIIYNNMLYQQKIFEKYENDNNLSYNDIVKKTQADTINYLIEEFHRAYTINLDKLPKKSKNNLNEIYIEYKKYIENKSELYEITAMNVLLNKYEADFYMYTNGYNVLEAFIIFFNIINDAKISEDQINVEFEKIKRYYFDRNVDVDEISSDYLSNNIDKTYNDIINDLISIKNKYKLNENGERLVSWEKDINKNIKLVRQMYKDYKKYEKLVKKFVDNLSFSDNIKLKLYQMIQIQELSNIQFMSGMIKDSELYEK